MFWPVMTCTSRAMADDTDGLPLRMSAKSLSPLAGCPAGQPEKSRCSLVAAARTVLAAHTASSTGRGVHPHVKGANRSWVQRQHVLAAGGVHPSISQRVLSPARPTWQWSAWWTG